jgi:hypothetical protein
MPPPNGPGHPDSFDGGGRMRLESRPLSPMTGLALAGLGRDRRANRHCSYIVTLLVCEDAVTNSPLTTVTTGGLTLLDRYQVPKLLL